MRFLKRLHLFYLKYGKSFLRLFLASSLALPLPAHSRNQTRKDMALGLEAMGLMGPNKVKTWREFWSKNFNRMTPETRAVLQHSFNQWADEAIPQITLTEALGKKGVVKMVVEGSGKTLTYEFSNRNGGEMKVDGVVFNSKDMSSWSSFVNKAEKVSHFRTENEQIRKKLINASLAPTYEQFMRMSPKERGYYFVNLRQLLVKIEETSEAIGEATPYQATLEKINLYEQLWNEILGEKAWSQSTIPDPVRDLLDPSYKRNNAKIQNVKPSPKPSTEPAPSSVNLPNPIDTTISRNPFETETEASKQESERKRRYYNANEAIRDEHEAESESTRLQGRADAMRIQNGAAGKSSKGRRSTKQRGSRSQVSMAGKPCIFAGYPSKYNGQGLCSYSLIGDGLSSQQRAVFEKEKKICGAKMVACNSDFFGTSKEGNPFCVAKKEVVSFTQVCHVDGAKPEDMAKKLAATYLKDGKLTKDKFNEMKTAVIDPLEKRFEETLSACKEKNKSESDVLACGALTERKTRLISALQAYEKDAVSTTLADAPAPGSADKSATAATQTKGCADSQTAPAGQSAVASSVPSAASNTISAPTSVTFGQNNSGNSPAAQVSKPTTGDSGLDAIVYGAIDDVIGGCPLVPGTMQAAADAAPEKPPREKPEENKPKTLKEQADAVKDNVGTNTAIIKTKDGGDEDTTSSSRGFFKDNWKPLLGFGVIGGLAWWWVFRDKPSRASNPPQNPAPPPTPCPKTGCVNNTSTQPTGPIEKSKSER